MTDPEIIRGLKQIALYLHVRRVSDPENAGAALDAAISRLSATCGTCAFGKHVDVFDVVKCVNPASFAFTLRTQTIDGCRQHTPRTEEP